MAGSMEDIKELRARTSAGVMDCKKALTEKDGDVDAAVEYLREKGMSEADDKAGRVAAEGKVNVVINDDKTEGMIVEVNSETDFVAKNDRFKDLVDKISQHIMQSEINELDALLSEDWYLDQDKDVDSVIREAIAEIGENINLRRFQKISTDGYLQGYIHLNGKIGVLVELAGEDIEDNLRIAKDLAMHIAASSPEYIDRDQVSKEAIKKEKKIYKEQMLNEGKPEHIIDNIVKGKMEKYYTQVCLLEQPFVRDEDVSVGELLEDVDISVKDFVRYELGEGIEVEEEDFAEEVKQEMNR
ncbi:MAG: translation elongation factor Ts [Halanaerobiaceae bacterium]